MVFEGTSVVLVPGLVSFAEEAKVVEVVMAGLDSLLDLRFESQLGWRCC